MIHIETETDETDRNWWNWWDRKLIRLLNVIECWKLTLFKIDSMLLSIYNIYML